MTSKYQQFVVLVEEIYKRLGLSKLKLHESILLNLEASSKSSVIESLSGVSCRTCTIVGHDSHSAQAFPRQFVSWDGSVGKRVLFASNASLKKLTLVDFDFSESKPSQLAQQFVNLVSLKLGGYGCADNLQHDTLEELDISGLRHPASPPKRDDVQGAWLPSLHHLTAPACYQVESLRTGSGKILLLGPLAERHSLPCNLKVLTLHWRMYLDIRDAVNRSRGKLLYTLLWGSDCPHLQRIDVQVTDPMAKHGTLVSFARIGQMHRAEAGLLFRTCPSLQELCFKAFDGDCMVKWVRTPQGVEESDWDAGALFVQIID